MPVSVFNFLNLIACSIVISTILNCFTIAEPEGFKVCHPDDPINNTTELHYAECASFPCPIRRGSNTTNTFSFVPDKDPGSSFKLLKTNCLKSPCVFKRGNNVSMELSFTSDYDQDELYHVVYLNLTGVRQNFPGVHNTNACPFLHPLHEPEQKGCPLKKGVEYLYKWDYNVIKEVPQIDFMNLHWALRNRENEKDAFCFEIPIKVE